ncbi:hypothetical protein [Priestia megaterium]|uniref:hypothetical protein n=1 Tax=Priestia megaterium TaxID=1404 RepID=UPI00112EB53D|nr:hypothetical protein [Priestia megaterium]TPF18020.1 hypothetical protein CBE78_01990 [Priestia megaterium]TPF22127.1 hypothetical protein CBE79_04495 [Priestia megaterium]
MKVVYRGEKWRQYIHEKVYDFENMSVEELYKVINDTPDHIISNFRRKAISSEEIVHEYETNRSYFELVGILKNEKSVLHKGEKYDFKYSLYDMENDTLNVYIDCVASWDMSNNEEDNSFHSEPLVEKIASMAKEEVEKRIGKPKRLKENKKEGLSQDSQKAKWYEFWK